ncbi:hypothetical protein [Cellulosimicrobium cellulans]|uniref:hypothetical protein n=1 Tax=Cellulosimicrobium cellulans TaxID=1710 RepID=UPI001BAD923E|nr:hypothetical protein [Cellulosimicrobium cellulans]QUC01093.1 hypothetical protein J5A69_07965 [Cellulosimicrobium cellulans]
MSEDYTDFWVMIATVLPVLGLAVLVVARAQLVNSLSAPRWVLLINASIFAFAISTIIVHFYASLQILAGEWEDTRNWRLLAINAALAAITVLFGLPLMNLAVLALRHPLSRESRFYYRKIARLLREQKRLARKTRRQLFRDYAEMTGTLESAAERLREEPFEPARPITDFAQRRDLIVSAARLVEQGVARGEAERAKIEREILERQERQEEMYANATRQFGRSLWDLFSASIGHTETEDSNGEESTNAAETPKLIVARPAPRPDDPPR